MREIYLNNQLVDLPANWNIALTLNTINIAETGGRKLSFSNEIPLPMTDNNRKITGYVDHVSSFNQLPYQKYDCRYIEDGITLVKGYAIVLDVTDTINIAMYFRGGDFWNSIEGQKLTDLDLSAYDHIHNKSNIHGSRFNTSGYIYPIIEYGKETTDFLTNGVTEIRNSNKLLPAIYAHTLVSKIFSTAGYSVLGDILALDKYTKLIVPATDEGYEGLHSIELRAESTGESIEGGGMWPISFSNVSVENENYNGTGTYTCDENIVGKSIAVNASVTISGYSNPGGETITLNILKNGSSVASSPISGNGTVSLQYTASNLVEDDAFSVRIAISGISFTDPDLTIDSGYFNLIENETIDIASMMPDMSQKDFLKTIFNLFAIIPIADDEAKTITFVQFKEIPAQKESRAVDYSQKLDKSKTAHIQYRAPFAQLNWMRWNPEHGHDNIAGEAYDGSFTVSDSMLEAEMTLFTLPFSGTPQLGSEPDVIPWIKMYDGDDWLKDITPRLLMINKKSGSCTFKNAEGNEVITTNIPYCAFVNITDSVDLRFSSLITNEYAEYTAMLDSFKMIKPWFKLKQLDVRQIDLSKPLWIDEYSSYFWPQKWANYIDGKSTELELIQLK